MTTATHLGAAELAAKLWTEAHVRATGPTISKWIERYANTTAPFPRADVTIKHGRGHVRGWLPDRWPEIERWATVERHLVTPLEDTDRKATES